MVRDSSADHLVEHTKAANGSSSTGLPGATSFACPRPCSFLRRPGQWCRPWPIERSCLQRWFSWSWALGLQGCTSCKT